ncbi:tRNA pseudouridine synthase A [Helicobacter heilmannii]|uniref:tRNA pseudouridine synthase A n=1 Tax=Helicobacter heilmannii TaxID=35817 RepID=A0A0K2XR30_HELHE|nr:tRNA pseudouridine(38-40) synthase TruA [Helicobacter heilmannii]CCM11417.1 tRNA pseudouridine synthase A [Helicobacter heilmannii ASB1.4]CRF45420.1 tRNA pseudouridine synthase A [Helicobacter heilmannii]CRF47566.1 tRNA pseudouridine synthase A [Helicobacter heilmannii]CRF49088.1 tRNA pseudouridine synthase A [Helicobacter heilmannii]CRF51030.1 tRNA pseudouridine synthase A [Helicobacter heilmannii]
MRRFKLTLAYDGSAFMGFAKQEGHNTIEGALESALKRLNISSLITAAGRTDKGVHAICQVVAFDAPAFWSAPKLLAHLAPKLAPYIVCKSLELVDLDFHPRFCAYKRRYRYLFTQSPLSPFFTRYMAAHPHGALEKIQEALNCFVGTHDFKYFCKTGSNPAHTRRTIFKAFCYPFKVGRLDLVVVVLEANGFLRSQVRLMLKAVLKCSLGQLSLADLRAQIALKTRVCTDLAPSSGLYLSRVFYPQPLSKNGI